MARHYALGDDVLGQVTTMANHVFFMDGHGSTRQLMASGGGVLERYDYDAYGEAFGWELDDPGSTVARPQTDILYAGEQWDANLGMQYLRARYYLPGQGVFNRVDPFFGNQEDPQSLHKYAYVYGDPANRTDPSGLFSLSETLIVSGIFSGLVSAGIAGGISAVTGGSLKQTIAAAVGAFTTTFLTITLLPMGHAGFFLAGMAGAAAELWINRGFSSLFTVYGIGAMVFGGLLNLLVPLAGRFLQRLGLTSAAGSVADQSEEALEQLGRRVVQYFQSKSPRFINRLVEGEIENAGRRLTTTEVAQIMKNYQELVRTASRNTLRKIATELNGLFVTLLGEFTLAALGNRIYDIAYRVIILIDGVLDNAFGQGDVNRVRQVSGR